MQEHKEEKTAKGRQARPSEMLQETDSVYDDGKADPLTLKCWCRQQTTRQNCLRAHKTLIEKKAPKESVQFLSCHIV